MSLIPSLRRALARLLGGGTTPAPTPPPATPRATPARLTPKAVDAPGQLISVGDHVIFATSAREAERALLLMMDGASDDLRRACGRALQDVQSEEAAA